MSLRTINVSQGSLAKVYEMALKLRADLHGKMTGDMAVMLHHIEILHKQTENEPL